MVDLFPFAAAWGVLALVVIVLGFMRKHVTAEEDDTLHLGGGSEQAVAHQQDVAKKLAALDKWGKILTVLLAVTGVVLTIAYFMQMWESTKSTGV